jgi:hypothetical protein
VPEMVRAQYKDAIARWRSEWRRMANDPATRGQLVAACKQAAEQQAAALKSSAAPSDSVVHGIPRAGSDIISPARSLF